MGRMYASFIGPRDDPFTDEVEGFWDDERTSVSTFTTGINNRNEAQCIIGNCDYDIPSGLDHCHIIQKHDEDTVMGVPSKSKLNASNKACLQKFHEWPCKLDALAKYPPHPNLFLYHESFVRAKFRIPKEIYLLSQTTNPSITTTSTTSIQTYDNVDPISTSIVSINTFQRQVQDHVSMPPSSPQRIDKHESLSSVYVQRKFIKPSNSTTTQMNAQSKAEPAFSDHPNLDIIFSGWETNSVKAMVLAKISSSAQDNFSHSPDESLEISHADTSSDLANSMSDYLPRRVENRITAWLQDVVEQSQTIIECYDNGWDSTSAEYWED